MISLEQIRSLENKVHTAVSRIRALSEENATLKGRLESYEQRIAELETLVSAFKADQEEIEAGIVSALKHLDELEDSVAESPETPAGDTHTAYPADGEQESAPDASSGATSNTEWPEQMPEPEQVTEPEPEIDRGQDPHVGEAVDEIADSERAANVVPEPDEEPTEENTSPREEEEPELDIF